MYRIFLTNFDYFIQDTFETLESAKNRAKAAGFDSTIYHGDNLLLAWSIIGGFREIR